MARFGEDWVETAATVEEGAVYAAAVGRVVVDDAVIHLSQSGAGDQFPDDTAILDFCKADHVRHPAELVGNKHYRFCNAVTFIVKMGFRLEEVLHIPEHTQKARLPMAGDAGQQKA